MLKGFLVGNGSSTGTAAPAAAAQTPKERLNDPKTGAAAADGASQPRATSDAATKPVHLDPQAWAANFSQCLELLKGPSDEKRFVGLLLATKLLPQGGDAAIRQVLDALGPKFLSRLLLPITRQRQDLEPPADDEAYQQQVMSSGLALAILSSACRLPELAAAPDMLDKVPALIKVVKAGGVGNLVPRPPSAMLSEQQDAQAAAAAAVSSVCDSLECLLGIAAAGGRPGAELLLAAGGLEAANRALAMTVGSQVVGGLPAGGGSSSGGAHEGGYGTGSKGASQLGPQSLQAAMCAVRLLGLLLEGTGSRAAVMSDHPDALLSSLAALGTLLGHPAVLAQQQQPAAAAAGPGGAPDRGEGDAAMLQLEALHTLLLLLPIPQELELHQRVSTAMFRHEWPTSIRRGLNWILRSRVGAVQKHSALQLSAALVDLAGPGWLLARGETPPEAFLQVLAETLHVETGLLLHDALYPDQAVKEEAGRSTARRNWSHPQPSATFMAALKESREARGAAAAGGSGPAQQLQQALLGDGVLAGALPEVPEVEMEDAEAAAGSDTAAAGNGGGSGEQAAAVAAAAVTTAGERAARMLPACYSLLEACIEVLASDAAMQEEEMMAIDEAGEEEEGEEEEGEEQQPAAAAAVPQRSMAVSAADSPRRRRASNMRLPSMSEKASQQLMYSLGQTIALVLQFMDVLQEQGGGVGMGPAHGHGVSGSAAAADAAHTSTSGGAAHGAGGMQAALALGAVRVLGRYLAEVPESHSEELRKTLPFMLWLGLPAVHSAAGAGGLDVAGSTSAVQFLMPGLLQATCLSSSQATALKRCICQSPSALGALVTFLDAVATEAAQLAAALGAAPPPAKPTAGSGPSTPTTNRSTGLLGRALRQAELVRAERAMADVCTLLLNAIDATDLAVVTRKAGGGSARFGGSSSGSATNLSSMPAPTSSGGAADGLSPVTRALVPAIASLVRWWRARAPWSGYEATLSTPRRCAEHLSHVRLMPRTLICCACLAGMTLESVARSTAAAASAALYRGPPAAGDAASGSSSGPGAVQAADAATVCELVLQALQAGCCFSLSLMEDEEEGSEDARRYGESGTSGSVSPRSGSMSPTTARDPMLLAPGSVQHAAAMAATAMRRSGSFSRRGSTSGGGPDACTILDDFPGDAEHAWERLGAAGAGLQEVVPQMSDLARAAGWVQQLLEAALSAGGLSNLGHWDVSRGTGREAALLRQQELVMQEVSLRLMLNTLQAPA
mmetsp:Transcript_36419/g.81053  ORF Transcript_36419/g.81053 Transcript_36419/m.81053 type:complete len:1243 (+) Transcript_36419:134-3862(+)